MTSSQLDKEVILKENDFLTYIIQVNFPGNIVLARPCMLSRGANVIMATNKGEFKVFLVEITID